jgi:hypothetical protein
VTQSVQYSVLLRTGRPRFDPPQEQRIFSVVCVHTGAGAHPISYPVGTGGPFPRSKALPRRDADHSPPSGAEVKSPWRVAEQLHFVGKEGFVLRCHSFVAIKISSSKFRDVISLVVVRTVKTNISLT